jgi:peptide chain release factor 2
MTKEEFWSSHEKMQELQKKKARLENILSPFDYIVEKLAYLEESSTLLAEEGGELFLDEISAGIRELEASMEEAELRYVLKGEHDFSNAIITIHPGAGGTESQDWAQMLMRMYMRWAENHDYEVKILDIQQADEAGIKSATFTVSGPYAYGHLKVEAGVHRLVRISPFDANKRRHTSFSAVLVFPDIQDEIDIEVKDDDLRIDTYRASGAGGQHVNKTSSAVRITHLPTGIVVSCQTDRSQHRNKENALKVLKARLYDLEAKKQEKEIEGLTGEKKEIAWGSQIRSYVLQPYRMVKDHRTGMEIGNVDAVLNGGIEELINTSLRQRTSGASTINK